MKRKKKNKPWMTVLLVILVIAVAAGCVALPFVLPKIMASAANTTWSNVAITELPAGIKPSMIATRGQSAVLVDNAQDLVYLNGTPIEFPSGENACSNPTLAEILGNGDVLTVDKDGKRLSVISKGIYSTSTKFEDVITDIALRGNGDVMIVKNGALYTCAFLDGTPTLTPYAAQIANAQKIACEETKSDVFVLTDNGIVSTDGTSVIEISTDADAVDLTVDQHGVYALRPNAINVIRGENADLYSLEGVMTNSLNAIHLDTSAVYGRGSLLITDDTNLYQISAATANTTVTDWTAYMPPVSVEAVEAGSYRQFTLERDVDVASYPASSGAFTTLSKDSVVFVLSMECDSEFFCQIIANTSEVKPIPNSSETRKFVSGFILRSALGTETADKTPPPFTSGTPLHEVTKAYKYPSVYAPVLATYAKNASLQLLPMYRYIDSSANRWYAVTTDKGVGYVLAGGILKEHYSTSTDRMKSDATLRAHNISGVSVYTRTEAGAFVIAEGLYLPDNARVTLAEKFDAKSEYTRIYYFDDNGKLDAYVKTSEVEKDGLGVIEAVAIALIILTVVAGAVVFLMRKRNSL